jgi:LysM repeat protein
LYEYIVRPGDTLNTIAKIYDINIDCLLLANPVLQKSLKRVGQKLYIPEDKCKDEVFFPRRYWSVHLN